MKPIQSLRAYSLRGNRAYSMPIYSGADEAYLAISHVEKKVTALDCLYESPATPDPSKAQILSALAFMASATNGLTGEEAACDAIAQSMAEGLFWSNRNGLYLLLAKIVDEGFVMAAFAGEPALSAIEDHVEIGMSLTRPKLVFWGAVSDHGAVGLVGLVGVFGGKSALPIPSIASGLGFVERVSSYTITKRYLEVFLEFTLSMPLLKRVKTNAFFMERLMEDLKSGEEHEAYSVISEYLGLDVRGFFETFSSILSMDEDDIRAFHLSRQAINELKSEFLPVFDFQDVRVVFKKAHMIQDASLEDGTLTISDLIL